MSKGTQTTPQGAAIIAVVGERGTATELRVITIDELTALVGGKLRGHELDPKTAVFYDGEKQTAVTIKPQTLSGTLVLCGQDSNGNPVSLKTDKQVTKYAKIFRKVRAVKADNTSKGGD